MGAAGARSTGAYRKLPSELGLTGGGQGRALFVPDANPFNLAPAHRVGEWIQGVADQPEYLPNSNLFQHADQKFRNCL